MANIPAIQTWPPTRFNRPADNDQELKLILLGRLYNYKYILSIQDVLITQINSHYYIMQIVNVFLNELVGTTDNLIIQCHIENNFQIYQNVRERK